MSLEALTQRFQDAAKAHKAAEELQNWRFTSQKRWRHRIAYATETGNAENLAEDMAGFQKARDEYATATEACIRAERDLREAHLARTLAEWDSTMSQPIPADPDAAAECQRLRAELQGMRATRTEQTAEYLDREAHNARVLAEVWGDLDVPTEGGGISKAIGARERLGLDYLRVATPSDDIHKALKAAHARGAARDAIASADTADIESVIAMRIPEHEPAEFGSMHSVHRRAVRKYRTAETFATRAQEELDAATASGDTDAIAAAQAKVDAAHEWRTQAESDIRASVTSGAVDNSDTPTKRTADEEKVFVERIAQAAGIPSPAPMMMFPKGKREAAAHGTEMVTKGGRRYALTPYADAVKKAEESERGVALTYTLPGSRHRPMPYRVEDVRPAGVVNGVLIGVIAEPL